MVYKLMSHKKINNILFASPYFLLSVCVHVYLSTFGSQKLQHFNHELYSARY